jgi:GABA permease
VAIFGMVGIVLAMAVLPDQRMPLALGVASLGVLLVAYLVRRLRGKSAGIAPETREVRGGSEP